MLIAKTLLEASRVPAALALQEMESLTAQVSDCCRDAVHPVFVGMYVDHINLQMWTNVSSACVMRVPLARTRLEGTSAHATRGTLEMAWSAPVRLVYTFFHNYISEMHFESNFIGRS